MTMINFTRPDGKEVSGFYTGPEKTNVPGIVVIQEWWGLNEQIKGVADHLAAAGYRALVPDLYRGQIAVEAKEAQHLMNGLNFGEAAQQDIRGAVQYLKTNNPKVAIMGFCMGGALTLLSAVNVPEANAAVIWYGFPPLDYIDAKKIKMPLLGHFAIDDAFFPIATLDDLEKKLRSENVRFEFHRYAARHAFANETLVDAPIPAEYNAPAAELAWERTMEF